MFYIWRIILILAFSFSCQTLAQQTENIIAYNTVGNSSTISVYRSSQTANLIQTTTVSNPNNRYSHVEMYVSGVRRWQGFNVTQNNNVSAGDMGLPNISGLAVSVRYRIENGPGQGWGEWSPFVVMSGVSQDYCVKWWIYPGPDKDSQTFANLDPYNNGRKYQMRRGSEILKEQFIPFGSFATFSKSDLETDEPVELWYEQFTSPYVWDESLKIWKTVVSVGRIVYVETQTPQVTCPGDEDNPVDVPPIDVPEVINPVNPSNPQPPPTNPPTTDPSQGSSGSTGTVWNSDTTGETLDESTFVEGIAKLEKQLIAINGKLGGGGGGLPGGGDPNAQAITDAAASGAASTNGQGEGEGTDQAEASTAQAFSAGKASPGFSLPSSGTPSMTIQLPRDLGTINLDPMSDSGVASAANFIRQVIIWLVGGLFAWFAWSQFRDVVSTLIGAQQAKGNAVIGGTGGQATALIAAGAITAVLVSVPVAFWGFADYSIVPVTSVSGPGSMALYLVECFIPISMILSTIATAFVIRKAAVVLVATTATLIRFIVP